jgi:hypothetical protein
MKGVSNPDPNPGRGFQPEPMRPVQDGGTGAEIPRPRAVDLAFRASLASSVIAAMATVVTVLLDRDWLGRFARQLTEDSGRQFDLETAISIAKVSIGFAVVLVLGLFLLFALRMRAGRSWARALLTMFAALGVMNFLLAVADTGAELELMWNLAEVAFAVTAVVYMFRPESTAYFTEHRKRRLARRGGHPHP